MPTFADFDFAPEPQQIQQIYESGFRGALPSDRLTNAYFRASRRRFYDDFPQAKGLHTELEVCMPIRGCQTLIGLDFCGVREESQKQGDSLPAGTMVRMHDGSEKPIECIVPGDYVISHLNRACRVVQTFKKTYKRDLIRIRAKGCARSVTTTINHEVVSYPGINRKPTVRRPRDKTSAWIPVAELDIGSHVLIPYGVDETLAKDNPGLAWLIGFFLAEGCVHHNHGKAVSISFNTDARRTDLHEKVRLIVKREFNVDVYGTYVNANDSCLQLRSGYQHIVNYFKRLCDKKAHDKFVPDLVFSMGYKSRLACLKGWLDGDGHRGKDSRKLIGSSMSRELSKGMQRLAFSCGIKAIHAVHERIGSPTSYLPGKLQSEHILSIGWGDCARVGLVEDAPVKQYQKTKHVVDGGIALPIVEYERVPCKDGFVYCLEVENDHGFISNGYATKNCVGKLVRNQGMIDGCLDAMFSETTWKKGSDGKGLQYCCENIYGERGHGGEGANCWTLWNSVSPDGSQGFLFRDVYGEYDLSTYNASLSGRWGRGGTPRELSEIAKQNPALKVYKAKSIEEVMDALALGFGVGRCGSDGYDSKRNEDGVSDPKGSWNHAIAVGAFNRSQAMMSKYDGELFLHYHNWGEWNSGPKAHEQPDGSWWVRRKFLERWVKQGECAIIGSVVGMDRQLVWEQKMDRRSFLIKEGVYTCVRS